MKKTVLFLGAGMSASFGYPVTRDILPAILMKIRRNSLFNEVDRNKEITKQYRCLLRQLIVSLSPGMAYIFEPGVNMEEEKKKLPLVTELLSQLEHLIDNGQEIMDWNFDIPGQRLKPGKISDRWKLADLKTLFEWAIIDVIDIDSPAYSENTSRFLSWLTQKNKAGRHFISVVSTNYDVALEWELLDYGQAWDADKLIDYGVSWRDPVMEKSIVYPRPAKPLYRILKLHGSVDWLKCNRCGFLYINPTVGIYSLIYGNQKNINNTCHCGYWPLQPVLITPSYIRKAPEPNLQEIWRNTFEELRTADEWIIVGYSLPAEDFDIRSLLLRALKSNEKDLTVRVIQRSGESRNRYDMFFGENNYTFIESLFEDYIPELIRPSGKTDFPFIKRKQ